MNKLALPTFHPEILHDIQELDYGLMPLFSPGANKYLLVIKATKEIILSAHVNKEFRIYLFKDSNSAMNPPSLVAAFFDDFDEPLSIYTPLYSDDPVLVNIPKVLSQESFYIFFFDETNTEMLRVRVINTEFQRFRSEIVQTTLPRMQRDKFLEVRGNILRQFGLRTKEDDINSFKIKILDEIYLDKSGLIRDGDPGPMQEEEIAGLFRRIFEEHEIYLNPLRADKIKKEKRELVDILIITDRIMLFVQAKDSPNTSDSLKRSMDRKRTTIRNHIKKATNQLRGTLNYARSHDGVTILLNKKPITIKRGNRQLIGIVIVQELLDYDYLECSAPVLKLVRELELPINLLDYPQLHILTKNLTTPARFIWGLFDALETALEKDQFPRSVFSGNEEILVDIEKQKTDDFFQHDNKYYNMSRNEKEQLFAGIRKISKTRRKYEEAKLESQMPFKNFYNHTKIKHKEEMEDYYKYEGVLDDDKEVDSDCAEFYQEFLGVFNSLNTSEMQNRIMYFIGGIYVRIWNISTPAHPVVKPYMVTLSKDEKFCATEEELKEWTQKWDKNNTFYYIETQDNRCRIYYY